MWDANVAISQQWKLKVHKILHKHKNHTTGKTKRAKDSNKTIPQLEKPKVWKKFKKCKNQTTMKSKSVQDTRATIKHWKRKPKMHDILM